MKVAQIQFYPELGNCSGNQSKIEALLKDTGDASLIVLPELANCGYKFKNRDHAYSVASEKECLNYVPFLIDYCKKNGVFIVSGYMEKQNDDLYNSAVLVSPDGIVGNYRKMHLFMDEKKIFKSGDAGLPVFNMGEFKIGMLICFDYLFPEVWRIMALKGADIVVHPSNLITRNAYIVVPAQALMNGYYVISSNRIGTDEDITFCGKSFVSDPRGKVISEMGEFEEGVRLIDINPLQSRDKFVTSGNHIFDDRQPENYNELFEIKNLSES